MDKQKDYTSTKLFNATGHVHKQQKAQQTLAKLTKTNEAINKTQLQRLTIEDSVTLAAGEAHLDNNSQFGKYTVEQQGQIREKTESAEASEKSCKVMDS